MTALRQRMLEDLQIRHYSKTTIRLYLHAVSVFAQHFGIPPDQLDAGHIRLYQLFLVQEKKVSLSTFIHSAGKKSKPFCKRPAIFAIARCWPCSTALDSGSPKPPNSKSATSTPLVTSSGCASEKEARIGKPCCRRGFWNCSAATGAPSAPWNGCSPAPIPIDRFPPKPFTWPVGMRRKSPASPNPFIRTPFGTMPLPGLCRVLAPAPPFMGIERRRRGIVWRARLGTLRE
jgi:hypothetical protein